MLRGLSYMLITWSATPCKSLLAFVGKECEFAGLKAFDGPGAWYRLETIFRIIMRDLANAVEGSGGTTYLVIDALNECDDNLENLLKLVAD